MVDQSGQRTWQAQTTAYGRIRLSEGTRAECPFRFQGQYEDIETGLYYNRFRYYDPQEGAYVSQDPIALRGGDKFYAYVDDPLNWVDQLGLACTAAGSLPQLRGKSVANIQRTLKKNGFTHRNPGNSRNERWVHTDGSEVQIHKYGNVNTTPHKSGNNAHVHKSIGRHGQSGSVELNDRGIPSTNPNDTHIGIKNPADYQVISGRPHGT
ncbi:RHS repeat-associated core domain-containing protein [Fibrella arboris]|uniref:RHS repeat-associated core domain-containing protein n=1 Tax=Fibrella arboris TaxID=3242486 RepID=UPI0035217EC4